jgi:hypothetical protein
VQHGPLGDLCTALYSGYDGRSGRAGIKAGAGAGVRWDDAVWALQEEAQAILRPPTTIRSSTQPKVTTRGLLRQSP